MEKEISGSFCEPCTRSPLMLFSLLHFWTVQLQSVFEAVSGPPLWSVFPLEPPAYLNWCSLELRILEEKRSASFSRLLEYSSSISAFLRKNSCRSCSSCRRDSDCCSRHLNCSTSWVRISARTQKRGRRKYVSNKHCPGASPFLVAERMAQALQSRLPRELKACYSQQIFFPSES